MNKVADEILNNQAESVIKNLDEALEYLKTVGEKWKAITAFDWRLTGGRRVDRDDIGEELMGEELIEHARNLWNYYEGQKKLNKKTSREDIIKFADSILKISQRFDDPNAALNYLLALGEGWIQVGEGVWEVIIEGENYQLDTQGILDRANIGHSYYGETTPQPTSEFPQGQPTYQAQQTQTFQPGGQVGQMGVGF